MPSTGSVMVMEDIIEELADREARANNLIFYNLEEPNQDQKNIDLVRDIVRKIQPGTEGSVKCLRLGKKRDGHLRPLRVSFTSRELTLSILRNKRRYSGPVRIYQDQTPRQRMHLAELRESLKNMINAGEKNKTIRYVNGVPKIVTATNSHSKN